MRECAWKLLPPALFIIYYDQTDCNSNLLEPSAKFPAVAPPLQLQLCLVRAWSEMKFRSNCRTGCNKYCTDRIAQDVSVVKPQRFYWWKLVNWAVFCIRTLFPSIQQFSALNSPAVTVMLNITLLRHCLYPFPPRLSIAITVPHTYSSRNSSPV